MQREQRGQARSPGREAPGGRSGVRDSCHGAAALAIPDFGAGGRQRAFSGRSARGSAALPGAGWRGATWLQPAGAHARSPPRPLHGYPSEIPSIDRYWLLHRIGRACRGRRPPPEGRPRHPSWSTRAASARGLGAGSLTLRACCMAVAWRDWAPVRKAREPRSLHGHPSGAGALSGRPRWLHPTRRARRPRAAWPGHARRIGATSRASPQALGD